MTTTTAAAGAATILAFHAFVYLTNNNIVRHTKGRARDFNYFLPFEWVVRNAFLGTA